MLPKVVAWEIKNGFSEQCLLCFTTQNLGKKFIRGKLDLRGIFLSGGGPGLHSSSSVVL